MALIRRVRTVMTGVVGAPYYSNLYFLDGVGTTQNLIDIVYAFWDDTKAFTAAGLVRTVEAEVPVIDTVTGDIGAVSVGTSRSTTSTATGNPLPPTSQMLVRLRTNDFSGGRRIQGKIFVPFIAASANDNGRPSVATRTSLTSAATNLVNDAATTLAVWSRKSGVAAAVSGPSVWDQYAVLRSRRD